MIPADSPRIPKPRFCVAVHPSTRCLLCRWLVSLALAIAWGAAVAADEQPAVRPATETLPGYLQTWNLDQAARGLLEEPSAWSDAKLQLAIRAIARLALAPPAAAADWAEAAADWPAGGAPAIEDRLVRIEGRAIFIAPLELPPALAEIAERKSIDVVRIRTAAGAIVDCIADAAPRAWQRWRVIDEPASVVGLPLTTSPGPQPAPQPAAGEPWPAEPHAVLLAAKRVAWHPATTLGGLGMDYGLFDTVVDGQKLVAGDTAAFYAMLAAAGRGTQEGIESAAGGPADVLPLIDPGRQWFTKHRGDPVTIEGTARRATRIQIDDPVRRRELGTGHYWELYVFVPTSLIKVNDRLQETYPLVCCVRSIPEGMPTGQNINEPVRVSGFAMKRYAYPLPRVQGEVVGEEKRQETPLLIARRAVWVPEPSTAGATSLLGWAFMGLAGAIGILLAFAAWRLNRDSRRQQKRQRDSLPEKLDLP
jgi:hypothetical protein